MHNLCDLANLLMDVNVKNVNSSLCALRRTNDNGFEIVSEVKISEDIQNKLLNVIQNELSVLEKEFNEL